MNIIVEKSKCEGRVRVPYSKSYLHRAIIAASLSNGESVINNVTLSKDIEATIETFRKLGATITLKDNSLIIKGIKDFNSVLSMSINCNESGSTLRFLIPILSLFPYSFTLEGTSSLFSRPLDIYQKIYKEQELKFELFEEHLNIEGKLKPGEYVIKGDVSSQFISGLLFALPLLENDSIIHVVKPFESESYVNMTISILSDFGIKIIRKSRYEFYIEGNQKYKPSIYTVERDYSQAAFYMVLGAINNDILLEDMNLNSLQGDNIIIDILRSFNVQVDVNGNDILIHKCNNLEGNVVNLSDCPDLGPICMVLSLFSKTPVRITNIQRLKIKESNRVDSMVNNLRKLNAKIDDKEDELIIYPSKLKATKEVLNSYNDHRIMMSLVVLATCIRGYTLIDNPSCVKKSYPDFYRDLQKLGINLGLHD